MFQNHAQERDQKHADYLELLRDPFRPYFDLRTMSLEHGFMGSRSRPLPPPPPPPPTVPIDMKHSGAIEVSNDFVVDDTRRRRFLDFCDRLRREDREWVALYERLRPEDKQLVVYTKPRSTEEFARAGIERIRQQYEQRAFDNFRREWALVEPFKAQMCACLARRALRGLFEDVRFVVPSFEQVSLGDTKALGLFSNYKRPDFMLTDGCESKRLRDRMGYFDALTARSRRVCWIATEDIKPGEDIEIWPDGTVHKAVSPPPPLVVPVQQGWSFKPYVRGEGHSRREPRLITASNWRPTHELVREYLRHTRALPKNPSRRQRKIKELCKMFC